MCTVTLSVEQDAIFKPSEEIATPRTRFLWPSVALSNIGIVTLSFKDGANCELSSMDEISCCVDALISHIRTVRSLAPETSCDPLGENARDDIEPV